MFPAQELIKRNLNKTAIVGLIPYLDDDVFRPVSLLEKYRPLGLETYLPFVRDPWLYLPHVAALARIMRLKLGLHLHVGPGAAHADRAHDQGTVVAQVRTGARVVEKLRVRRLLSHWVVLR